MHFIRLNEENIVISVRTGKSIIDGEIESETGKLGQRLLEDGTFVDVPLEPVEPQPTIEEHILAENQYQTMLLELTTILGGM